MQKSRMVAKLEGITQSTVQFAKKQWFEYSFGEQLFLIFFILISLGQSIGVGAKTNYINILVSLLAIPFWGYKVAITQGDKRTKIISIVLIVYALLASLISKDAVFLVNIGIIIAADGCRLGKCIRAIFWFRLICMLLVILSSIIGIRENNVYFLQKGAEITDTVRNSLGYYHPNVLVYYAFVLFSMYFFAYWERIKWHHFLAVLVLTGGLYFITWSKTGIICTAMLIGSMVFLKYTDFFKKILEWRFWKVIMLLIICASIVVMLSYNDQLVLIEKVNRILQGRFSLAHTYLQEYGINILGRDLPESLKINGEVVVIDSAYIRVLFEYGVVGITVFTAGAMALNVYLSNKKNKILLIILILFGLYGICERGAIDFSLAFPYIFLSKILLRGKRGCRK